MFGAYQQPTTFCRYAVIAIATGHFKKENKSRNWIKGCEESLKTKNPVLITTNFYAHKKMLLNLTENIY